MVHTRVLLFVLAVLALTACEEDTTRRMEEARVLIDTNPGAAIVLLRSDSAESARLGERGRALYALLMAETEDKCYLPHGRSADVERAVAYFDGSGDDAAKARAHYLLGRVYSGMGRAADAMRQFRVSLHFGGSGGYAALSLSNIGHLWLARRDGGQALRCFRRSYDMAEIMRDTSLMVFSLRDQARCHKSAGRHDRALACLSRADTLLRLSRQAHDLAAFVYPEYISLLVDIGRAVQARRLAGVLSGSATRAADPASAWLAAGRMYRLLGQTDSAEHCFYLCMGTGNVVARAGASMYLGEIMYGRGDYSGAYGCAMECAALTDSARGMDLRESRNLVSSLNGQLATERENYRLYRRMAVVVAVSVTVAVALVMIMRHRVGRLRRRAERYRAARDTLYRNSLLYMDKTRRNIERLNREIAEANDRNDMLQARLLTLSRERERQRLAMAVDSRSRQDSMLGAFRSTALYSTLAGYADGTLSGSPGADVWKLMYAFLDSNADGFVSRLTAFYPRIKPQETNVCCLIKLGFTNSQIAGILCRTQQAVTNLRKRLYAKMFDKDGTADDLNSFIVLFPDSQWRDSVL